MKWPEIVEFNDLIMAPVRHTDVPNEMKCAASESSDILGHYRFGKPTNHLQFVPLSEKEAAGAKVVEEPVIYGGLLFKHFGHMITESLHRLWPRFACPELRSAKIVFNPFRSARMNSQLGEALRLHGIAKSEVLMIREPMRFRRLFVGAQARQMVGPTVIDGYKGMLDPSLEYRLPVPSRDRHLYISRLDYYRSGSIYGESEIARQLAAVGFEIVYPERHSVTELVTMLRDAKIAIFAEGSAVHALELCGSIVPDVLVIARRHKCRKRFGRLLENVCDRWLVSEHVMFSAGMTDYHQKDSAVVNLPRVMADISSFAGIFVEQRWSLGWAETAIAEDCERLISDVQLEGGHKHVQRAARLRSEISVGTARQRSQ